VPFDERCAAGKPADFLQFRQSHGLFVDFGITPATTGLLAPRGGRTMKSGKTLISLLTITHAFLCLHESPGRSVRSWTHEATHRHWTGSTGIVAGARHRADLLEVHSSREHPRGNLISPGAHFAD
jgi:hypothetical protein